MNEKATSTQGFTPGKWLINDEGWRSQIVAIGSDRTIAEVFHTDEEKSALAPFDEGKANARLISAAPDLLAACQMALNELSRGGFTYLNSTLTTAIRKAKGKHETT